MLLPRLAAQPPAWLPRRYIHTAAMLTQASAQALARLRAYTPPPTRWYDCPLTRRAAVLILLFPDRYGNLKVVLTMRASTLRSYAGQAALPGGKADTLTESPFDTARREAYEEIGLPTIDSKLPPGFKIEHLCELPANLAKTELGVRPCVAFLSPSTTTTASSSPSAAEEKQDGRQQSEENEPSVEETMIPRLDPKEVAAVFTAPFHNFLNSTWQGEGPGPIMKSGKAEKWYRGSWTDWHESRWRMHNFYIPRPPPGTRLRRNPDKSTSPPPPPASPSPSSSATGSGSESREGSTGAMAQKQKPMPQGDDPRPEPNAFDELTAFRVFGMTARILVDAARVAYAEEPEFEHNAHHGDEEMIGRLLRIGRLSERREKGEVLTREIMRKASRM